MPPLFFYNLYGLNSISSLDYVTKESREICMRRSSVQLQARIRVVQLFVFEAERKRWVILPFSTSISTIYSLLLQNIEGSCNRNYLKKKFTNKSSWKGERCSNIIVGAKMNNVVPTGPHIVWLVSWMSTRATKWLWYTGLADSAKQSLD